MAIRKVYRLIGQANRQQGALATRRESKCQLASSLVAPLPTVDTVGRILPNNELNFPWKTTK